VDEEGDEEIRSCGGGPSHGCLLMIDRTFQDPEVAERAASNGSKTFSLIYMEKNISSHVKKVSSFGKLYFLCN
jgi:hypothetical protein